MMVPEKVGQPAYRLYQWFWTALDWLYPPECGGCRRPGTRWCPECQSSIQALPGAICPRCKQALRADGSCPKCKEADNDYQALASWAVFNGALRNAIHRLKYQGDIALGEILARPLIQKYLELKWKVDLVTPVPLGIARRAQRGYNQATYIARPLALGNGLAFRPAALVKARETPSQVGLNPAERRVNVAQAFRALPHLVAGKAVLLVDDVTTTGATLESCAAALQEAGARQVFAMTLARAQL